MMALYNKIELHVRAKRSKEEIIREIVIASLKETAKEKSTKSIDNYGELDASEHSNGKFTAMPGRNNTLQKHEESIFNHIINSLTSKNVPDNVSRSQMLKIIAKSGPWSMLEAYSMLDESVPEAKVDNIKGYISKIVALIAANIGEKGARNYYRKPGPYVPGMEEFDLDLTLEKSLGKQTLEYEDIVVIHRRPRKLVVSLMLDISNSMQRSRIITAAIAVAALAYKLEKDYYSVVVFKEKAETLKSIMETLSMEELIMKILNLKTGGLTNIKEALEKGAEELNLIQTREQVGERIGIIVTDGWVTAGGDPRDAAIRFPKLHVVQVGIGGGMQDSVDLAKDLARIGKGEYIFVEDFSELPNCIMRIFR
ncbi:MAG: vWA domain-containing protein, partial [Candidatus Bathyarchaeia archaeon]